MTRQQRKELKAKKLSEHAYRLARVANYQSNVAYSVERAFKRAARAASDAMMGEKVIRPLLENELAYRGLRRDN